MSQLNPEKSRLDEKVQNNFTKNAKKFAHIKKKQYLCSRFWIEAEKSAY